MTTGWLRSPNGEVAVDKPRIGSKKRWCEMNLPNYSIGRHRQLGSPANLTGIPFLILSKMKAKRCGRCLIAWTSGIGCRRYTRVRELT